MKWRREKVMSGVVDYLPEPPRKADERTSYVVSMTYGLLLGRVYSTFRDPVNGGRIDWWAQGWTPATERYLFGPYPLRWDAFVGLYLIERGVHWPDQSRVTAAAFDDPCVPAACASNQHEASSEGDGAR